MMVSREAFFFILEQLVIEFAIVLSPIRSAIATWLFEFEPLIAIAQTRMQKSDQSVLVTADRFNCNNFSDNLPNN